jgi:hypothetical protein
MRRRACIYPPPTSTYGECARKRERERAWILHRFGFEGQHIQRPYYVKMERGTDSCVIPFPHCCEQISTKGLMKTTSSLNVSK